jgi:hypothetical protein
MLSVTVRLKDKIVVVLPMIGATNVGVTVFAPFSDTVVPETCVQAYEIIFA